METPVFALRLPKALQDQIADMAKVYGSPTPRAFLRELIETVLSGDFARVNAFNVRLVERLTGQLHLKMEEDMVAVVERSKARTARKPRKKRKARNERTT